MGRVEGKVAFITGVARGQGRSHALRLAEEGADILGVDVCAPIDSVAYPMASATELEETVQAVERVGRRMIGVQADVRDYQGLKAALDDGVAQMGGLDIVVANAGIVSFDAAHTMSEEMWSDMIGIALTGVWHTAKAAIPHLVKQRSGAIIIISSGAGFKGAPGLVHYCAAKHGVVGLMRALAVELGPSMIRVNTVHPTNVETPMILNDAIYSAFRPDLESPGVEDIKSLMTEMNAMPLPWVEPIDVSNAILYLASDEARYVTGIALPVNLGQTAK
jgi:(+)-trans-carveol dehydrogenase